MTKPFLESLTRKTRFYSDGAEEWNQLHNEAERCFRLEMHLVNGIRLFDRIEQSEREWKEAVASGKQSATSQEIESINQLWEMWLAPCANIEDDIEAFEALGYDVDCADEFRFACQTARHRDPSDLSDVAEIRAALEDPETVSHAEVREQLGLDT